MASRRVVSEEATKTRRPPGTSPTAREQQLISLAYDLAEKQMADGTASSQVTSHFLKMGSSREALEQERIERENELLSAKAEQLASQARVEELYKSALDAMRSYAGAEPTDHFDD